MYCFNRRFNPHLVIYKIIQPVIHRRQSVSGSDVSYRADGWCSFCWAKSRWIPKNSWIHSIQPYEETTKAWMFADLLGDSQYWMILWCICFLVWDEWIHSNRHIVQQLPLWQDVWRNCNQAVAGKPLIGFVPFDRVFSECCDVIIYIYTYKNICGTTRMHDEKHWWIKPWLCGAVTCIHISTYPFFGCRVVCMLFRWIHRYIDSLRQSYRLRLFFSILFCNLFTIYQHADTDEYRNHNFAGHSHMGTHLFDPIFNYIKQTWRLFRRDYPRPHPRSAQGFRMMCNGGVLKVPGYIKTLWELDMEQDQCLPSQCWLIDVTYWC